jgi:glycosyltransferase involved in cell wall biosynthesis
VSLGTRAEKVGVVANSPSLARFDPRGVARRAFAEDGAVRLVYAGALTPVYEIDVVIDAIAELRRTRPELDIRFDVYGRGDASEPLAERARDHEVADRITFHGRIPIEDVPLAVSRADIGVAPTRRDPFTDVSLSTKVFEYAAMGKPVVASRLPLVEHTFPAGTVTQYEPGDASGLAAAIAGVIDDPLAREAAVERTAAIVAERAWEREAEGYIALVDRLATDTRNAAAERGEA